MDKLNVFFCKAIIQKMKILKYCKTLTIGVKKVANKRYTGL